MRVVGVDPGTVVTGWGVVDVDGSRLTRVASGTIAPGRVAVPVRLAAIYEQLTSVFRLHEPSHLSLERNFLARNVQSAFRLGEARGVAMAAGAACGLELTEYTPMTVKKAVVGYGRADKAQVQAAVVRLFSLTETPAEDEADALAAAVCYALSHAFHDKLGEAVGAEKAPRRGTSWRRSALAERLVARRTRP